MTHRLIVCGIKFVRSVFLRSSASTLADETLHLGARSNTTSLVVVVFKRRIILLTIFLQFGSLVVIKAVSRSTLPTEPYARSRVIELVLTTKQSLPLGHTRCSLCRALTAHDMLSCCSLTLDMAKRGQGPIVSLATVQ